MNKHKKLITAIVIMITLGVLFVLSQTIINRIDNMRTCEWKKYTPLGTKERFFEILLTAYNNNDYELIEQLVAEDMIDQFAELVPQISSEVRTHAIDALDWAPYNQRLYLTESSYVHIQLAYDGWDECPVENFTDEEVIQQFKLIKISTVYDENY